MGTKDYWWNGNMHNSVLYSTDEFTKADFKIAYGGIPYLTEVLTNGSFDQNLTSMFFRKMSMCYQNFLTKIF